MKAIAKTLAIATLLSASVASATVINGNGLQNGLNAMTSGSQDGSVAADFYDVNGSQVAGDQVWQLSATGFSANRLMFEFAGYANANTFGIYDITDTSNRLEIFNGAAASGAGSILEGLGNTFSVFGGASATFASSTFGYYLSGPGGMFYSQDHLNEAGADQMVTFRGGNDLYMNTTGYGAGLFTSGEYILAWEDLRFSRSDRDFSDFVVMVESVTPVPAPASLLLLGMGLFAGGAAARRRRKDA